MRLRGRDDHATLRHRCAVEKWVMRDDAPPIGKRWAFVLAGALHGGAEGSCAFPRGGAIPRKGAFGVGGGSWFVRGATGQEGCREDEEAKKQRSHFEPFGK